MRTARPCSITDSVSGLPTSRTIRSTTWSLAASSAAAAADSASARASALRDHSLLRLARALERGGDRLAIRGRRGHHHVGLILR